MSVYSEADDIEFFNSCLDNLVEELFKKDNDIRIGLVPIAKHKNVRKSTFIASILASSSKEEHRKKALAFAILAYTKYRGTDEEELYERYLYVILSRIGDLPAIGSFVSDEERKEYDQKLLESLDFILTQELDTYRQKYRLDDEHYLSEFQGDVYNALSEGSDVAISGPTSSGKSFVLQQYIEDRVEKEEQFEVIYVVPTRALISEVSADLKAKHEEITVKTSANFTEEDEEEDVFLVVTPERCLKLLRDEMKEHITPELIFFDEFQKIEEGERGIVFENVVESLHEMWPRSQIAVAGPYLDDPREKLENITGREAVEIKTFFTPILQLKIFLTFESQRGKRELRVTILSPSGEERQFTIDEPDGLTFSQFNTNKGEFLQMALEEFGAGDQNLVYASRKDYAERWARTIAEGNDQRTLSEEGEALRDFLAQSIHDEYTLIYCLERGVAFHHRMVPKIARTKIEEIYRHEEDLETIVSTSTLLEGVNLPAENIFVHDPSKGTEDLSDFDFKNLIGRVGRLNQKLYGSIYCLQTEEEEWSEERLSNTENKEIEPATEKAMRSDLDELTEVVEMENIYEEEEPHLRYTGILLRNKHLRDKDELSEYLDKKEVPDDNAAEIKTNLSQRLEQIEIPEGILRRNPTIDPVQQDKLYRAVKQNPDDWIIAENRSGYDYDDFKLVTQNLNEVFLFSDDTERDISPSETEIEQHDIEHVVVPANQWLNGYTLREMIEARQTHKRINDRDVNDSIRSVLQIVNDDIRFVLVKYYRILTDILEETETTDSEWMLTFDQMLEMGSLDFNELDLMSMGVDRSVVIDLDVPPHVDDVVEYLEENKWKYPKFYLDHLKEQDVL